MRENNRNSIEKCRKKLPQFTTMNVIDGQAGLISYFSLIFYSLTIDNILNIIVLLILAGVTIATLSGSNGILNNAQDSKTKTEIANLEEEARIIYSELLTNKYTEGGKDPSLGDVINRLTEKGYNIVTRPASNSSITGITLSSTQLTLSPNETAEITVTLEGSGEGTNYYAEIDGNYYLITQENGNIEVAEEKTEIEDGENTIIAESSNPNITVEVEGNKIKVTGGKNTETATITVSYGTIIESCAVAVVIKPTESSVADANKQIETPYGTIEVIWLDTENNVIENPNEPKLTTGMEKVTWTKTGDTWTEDATAQAQWYNYKKGTGKEDNLESMWANVKLDGSYFGWVPRYAYRITYYSDEALENITGYYDGWGMWSAEDGTLKYKIDNTLETVQYQGNKYIVHPAFMNDTENTWSNGGWDSDLSGIWVAKYEVSGSSEKLKVVPNESSLREITIGVQYTAGINYGESIGNTSINSHMMKNSEWGAVVYLAHSQYGRNGHEVDINNSSSYITGNGGGSPDASEQSGTTNPFNTTIGAKASTTGNVYGIYDMSGGAYERVAAFNSVDTNGYFSTYGWTTATGLTTESNSTKYATKYDNTGANVGTTPESTMSKIGDALIEVNKSIGSSSISANNHWFNDYSYFASSSGPFFLRGGHYNGGASAGLFNSDYSVGGNYSNGSFRLALCF